MNIKIITYLTENKNKFSKESLRAELIKAGYDPIEIMEAINNVYGGIIEKKKTFLLFDFLIGIFGPFIILVFLYYLTDSFFFVFLFGIFGYMISFVISYYKNRSFFKGLLWSILTNPFLLITFYIFIELI